MLDLVAFSDLLGDAQLTARLLDEPVGDCDALVFLGDIPDPQMFKELRMNRVLSGEKTLSRLMEGTKPPEGLRRAMQEVRDVADVFARMSKRKKLLGVLGNADLAYYTREVDLSTRLHLLHGTVANIGDYTVVGYEGRPGYVFEETNPDERVFGEDQIFQELAPILKSLDSERTILATHVPPHGILDQVDLAHREYAKKTYGEKAAEGRIGSLGLRKLVDEFEPAVHVFGHIHECKGVCLSNSTLFVNVGSLAESHDYVRLTVSREKREAVFARIGHH